MNKKLKVLFSLLILSLVLGIAFRSSEKFAELYTLYIAPAVRIPLSLITSPFPFSVGESTVLVLVLMCIVAAVSGMIRLISKAFSLKYSGHFKTYSRVILYTLAFIYFSYAFGFSSSYSRVPISESMKLEKVEMTSENITEALVLVSDELEKIADDISYVKGNATVSGMSLDDISTELQLCAKRATEKYPFFQKHPFKAKPIAFSSPLAYTGISGIYSFFTGESNINP